MLFAGHCATFAYIISFHFLTTTTQSLPLYPNFYVSTIVDPWITWVWTMWVYLHIAFFKYTVGPLYPWVLHPQIQPILDQKQYFPSAVGNTWMQRANCRHWSVPLCISIWASVGGPGTISLWILSNNCS